MDTPKKEFLRLIGEIKNTEVSKQLCAAQNAEDFKKVWLQFKNENKELITQIRDWEEKNLNFYNPIFKKGEQIKNPMEIVICIHLMKKIGREFEIFQNELDLADTLEKVGTNSAKKVAALMHSICIHGINEKQIFKI